MGAFKQLIALSFFLFSFGGMVFAGPVTVALEPIRHQQATLDIRDAENRVTQYAPADLERFPTYRIVTRTPWRDQPAAFEGVLLSDLLAFHGMADAASIRVIAENDYATTIERRVWESVSVLIATRVDGRAHNRRARGPIQFIVAEDDIAGSGIVQERHLVWMAKTIEIAE